MRHLADFYFRIDLRSLAVFRILLGGLCVHDLFVRGSNLDRFYTSEGVLPAAARVPKVGAEFHFSLLDFIDTPWLVHAVFAIGLVAGLAFLLGYHTRFAQFLLFLFEVSVRNRNPLVSQGVDATLVTFLLWTLFLPMGQRFSIDGLRLALRRGVDLASASDPAPEAGARSVAAGAIVLQLGLVYFMTAFAKSGEAWRTGTAIYYALHLDLFATPFGSWLAAAPLGFLSFLSWGTLVAEFAALPLLLLPFPQPSLRRIFIVVLGLMHLGTALTLEIGSFPFVMLSTYVLLLSAQDWRALRQWALRRSRPLTVYYDDSCGFCHRCCEIVALADVGRNVSFVGASQRQHHLHALSESELQTSLVAFDARDHKSLRAAAVARVFGALPWPWRAGVLLDAPGLRRVANAVYDSVARRRRTLSVRLGLAACGTTLPEPAAARAAAVPFSRVRRAAELAGNFAAAALVATVLVNGYNSSLAAPLGRATVREPRWMRAVVLSLDLVPGWRMFAPEPLRHDGWWVLDGVTSSGRHFDPLSGRAIEWGKPPRLSRRYDIYERMYYFNLSQGRYRAFRPYFARYVARRARDWLEPGESLAGFGFVFVQESTPPPGTPPPWPTQRFTLWEYDASRDRVGGN